MKHTNPEGWWHEIDENTPKDRPILVFAPGHMYDLNDVICVVQYDKDFGFTMCELRHPTHWMPWLPPPTSLDYTGTM